MKTVAERVQSLVATHTGRRPADVTPQTRLVADLDCDDLERVEIVMTIESDFAIELPDDECVSAVTVGDLSGLAERYGARCGEDQA